MGLRERWLIWRKADLRGNGWGPPEEEPRVVRYRWSPSMDCYVEVVYNGKYYCDGFTMFDGFVPPEGMA